MTSDEATGTATLPVTPGLGVDLGDDGVAQVSIERRSKANTIDKAMHTRLTTLWTELSAVPTVGAIVLTGSGSVFCGGGDRDGWASLIEDRTWRHQKMWEARAILYDMLRCPVPIVAAVNGPAIGLGLSLALCCDYMVMADGAYLLDPHVPTGLVAGDGGAALLPALLPLPLARKMLFAGYRLSAVEAHRAFLAGDVVPADEVPGVARSLAATLASQPKQAVHDTKRAINMTLLDAITSAIELSSACEEMSFDTPEYHARIGYTQGQDR